MDDNQFSEINNMHDIYVHIYTYFVSFKDTGVIIRAKTNIPNYSISGISTFHDPYVNRTGNNKL